jgi:hypothetical protein
MAVYRWYERRTDAAELVASGRLTDLEISAKTGISDRQLRRWKHIPEFRARVEEYVEARRKIRMEEEHCETFLGSHDGLPAAGSSAARRPEGRAAKHRSP